MFELPLQITSTYVGPERTLSVPGLFRIFQDAAIADAERIGYGQSRTMGVGLLWVFSRVYVRFHHMPKYLSKARFETHPGGKKAFVFCRYGTLLDEHDEVAAEVSSYWALIHEDTRKAELRPNLPDINETNGKEVPLPPRIQMKECSLRKSKKIEYADIDLNGHLNNVRYIEMIVNLHDAAFYQDHPIASLLVSYESEIKEGETVDLYVDEKVTYVRGVVGDRICFEANLEYGEI